MTFEELKEYVNKNIKEIEEEKKKIHLSKCPKVKKYFTIDVGLKSVVKK